MSWPPLDDTHSTGDEVTEFFQSFEDMCQIPNDGRGMNDIEVLVSLKTCIKGSCLCYYDNTIKKHRDAQTGQYDIEPKRVYSEIKERLMRFQGGETERILATQAKFDSIMKGKRMMPVARGCANPGVGGSPRSHVED